MNRLLGFIKMKQKKNLKVYVKKATKFDEIFTVDLTLCSKCQIHSEDFINFCGILRKPELQAIKGCVLKVTHY